MEESKKSNKKVIIICLLVLGIVLIFSGYFISQMLSKTDDNENSLDVEETDDNLKYTMNIYKNESGSICLNYDENYCKDVSLVIKTETENAKIISVSYGNTNYFLYEDNGLKIYDTNLKKSTKISLDNNYQNYNFVVANDKLLGIIYSNPSEDDCKAIGGYYNLDSKQKMYDEKYDTISSIYNSNYLNAAKGNNIYLLNTGVEKEEIVYEMENLENRCYIMIDTFRVENVNDKNFYYVTDVDGFNIFKVYSNSKELIFDKTLNEGQLSFKDQYAYIVDSNTVKKYDIDGKLVLTSKNLTDVKGLIENYAVYVLNNKLMLSDVDKDEAVSLGEWKSTNRYDNWAISGYYTRSRLDSMGETDKPEGVYVVVYYDQEDSNGNYGIEYCYTTTGEVKTFAVKTPEGGRAKPVLYLYPPKTLNVEVSFAHPEYLTTTYPKYEKSWHVVANPNGDLYDKNNKYYYALYWDEVRFSEVDFHEGFFVSDNAIEFLEEKLTLIGLNDRERNEFIMYWLPVLEKNGKSLVYFELTSEREKGNKLIITPTPDSMIRVSIHIKKVNNYVDIKEQKLKTFKRFGFTVVEWGGMTY